MDKIDQNLEQIKKYLEASEEIIKREAHEQPKIKKSYEELVTEITKLETIITNLETKQQQLKEKSDRLIVAYAVGGTLAGIVGTITF